MTVYRGEMGQDCELASELTDQELVITGAARVDIGAGYPHLELPDWMWAAVTDTSRSSTVYGFAPGVAGHDVASLTTQLLRSFCELLAIDTAHEENAFATFSGSVALDRAISTVAPKGSHVVSSSPSIDIIAGMLSERAVETTFVETADGFALDVEGIRRAIRPTTKCIILTSPENPTGAVISEEQLRAIATLARDCGITLVLDQCFALIDPFSAGIPLLPTIAPEGLSWIFLWDTGKTFGLNEEKLGFIVCSPDLRERVARRLNILQFDVSRRLKLLFHRLFREARRLNYASVLSSRVRHNIGLAVAALEGTKLQPIVPNAGSFLLLDALEHPLSASSIAAELLNTASLGVIRIDSFFAPRPPEGQADRYLRLAMARESNTVAEAMHQIAKIAR